MAPACAPRRRRRLPPRGVPVEAAGGGPSLERVPGPGPAGAAPLFRREPLRDCGVGSGRIRAGLAIWWAGRGPARMSGMSTRTDSGSRRGACRGGPA